MTLTPATPYLKYADDGRPFLQGSRCSACGQVFLGARENCARCAARGQMQSMELGTTGRLYNYTIVYRSYPGVTVPFISAVVDLDGGGSVKGNLIDVEPDPARLRFDMKVQLVFRGAELANSQASGFLAHFFIPAPERERANG